MNENGGFFSGDWLGAFLIIAVMFGGFNGGFGWGGNAALAGAVTQADVQGMINAQTNQATLENIMLSSANNNYETLKNTNDQTMFLSQQNNTNLINGIQNMNQLSNQITNGFNTVNQNMCNGFNGVQQSIADLGYKMDQCCCSIKTTLLENRLADAQSALANAQDIANNSAQSAYILSQLGKFVPNAPAAATT
jgi:hypothetical protein